MSTISRLITVGAATLCLVLFATPGAYAASVPIASGTPAYSLSLERIRALA